MAKLTLIEGTKDCSDGAEVRRRVRDAAKKLGPCCNYCGGREYITAWTGRTKSKLCVVCLLQNRRQEIV